MTFGSLFAGIGGFDLGFERAGMACKWQVEIDPYCQKVLAKHWPNVRRHHDIKTFPTGAPQDWKVDCVCGGFPCQDISTAGRGEGITGERSGLWSEYARVVGLLRPRFVVVENVPALLFRGMDRVTGDLAAIGYDTQWQTVSAAAVGSPQRRERVFILAYRDGERLATDWNQTQRSLEAFAKEHSEWLRGRSVLRQSRDGVPARFRLCPPRRYFANG